jgi:transposase
MPTARFIRLTPEEDALLREAEQHPHLRAKVRLRAQVLRLSNQSWKVEDIARYTGRSQSSIYRDFNRWEEHCLGGLGDSTPPGNPLQVTKEVQAFLCEKLKEERAWNGAQLADAVEEHFDLRVDAETIRRHLQNMGYSWKRSRYVPAHSPNPEEERTSRAALETLKRGRGRSGSASST